MTEPYQLFGIRNTKTGHLLTMLAATSLSGAENGISDDRRVLDIEGAMVVLDFEGRNPIFLCDRRELVESLLRTGCAGEYMNHITLQHGWQEAKGDLELVEISATVTAAEIIPRDPNPEPPPA